MAEYLVGKERPASTGCKSIPIVGGRPNEFREHTTRQSVPLIHQARRRYQDRADVTLINMNLLYVNLGSRIDHEIHPPLGLLYLTSVLEQAGYVVDLIDYQTFPIEKPDKDPFDLKNAVGYFGDVAEIVGLSCMANLLPFTLLVAKRLKELHPNKTIILGGVGPFGVEDLILECFPSIDVVVRGEAEATAVKLMEALPERERLTSVPGISYRRGDGTIVRTAGQPRIRNLDNLPLPAYRRLNMRYYDAFGIISSRGCPYGCRFCSVAPIWGHRTTYRSHENIIEEMRLLYETYGVKQVLFQDEFFYSSESKILSFCDHLIASGLPITWKCFGRVNLVTERAMRRMAEAGCIQLRFGVESASDRILEKVVKGFRFKDALRAVTEALQIFESVETFFIWGFPFEEMEDFYQTAIQMARFRQMGVTVLPSLLSLLPQTAIYDDVRTGRYRGEMSLVPELVPIYVVTGHEVLGERNSIPERYRGYYEFIESYPDVFPGFFLFNYDENILPKHRVLREMGFL